MFGVSAPQLIAWLPGQSVTAATMRSLPQSTAQAIYAARFWQSMRCDDLPAGVDLSTADMGYNAGDAESARLLQSLLGFAAADVDGWIGPQTIAAAAAPRAQTLAAALQPSSARALQTALSVSADGAIGPETLAALQSHPGGPSMALCCALADKQAAYYRGLGNFKEYGNGWLARVGRRLTAALGLLEAPAA